ncbi:MAG: 3-methyl-2-oxobutanoate hydroxymethyltransferase [Candidatus Marinimicrobia bacterium]|nr:3-methyl-2-oxobutanoate hydroxymethyltransferase [Candidatus Neomarinimicrobiota bacterium]
MKTIRGFHRLKEAGEPISLVTCYDYTSAQIVNASKIDAILVGDSASMVMHGHESTVNANLDMLVAHVEAVRRGAPDKFLIADMPFLAHRKGLERTMNAVEKLIQAGAQAVKIEGLDIENPCIPHIVKSGVPVMGHLGLTPQSVHQIGGWVVQGKDQDAEALILEDAKILEDQGCFSLVLEMVPADLAQNVTLALNIPTIGIGAGAHTSGQILVFQDLLGMNAEFKPKFLRRYLNGFELIRDSLDTYSDDVKMLNFPSSEESF